MLPAAAHLRYMQDDEEDLPPEDVAYLVITSPDGGNFRKIQGSNIGALTPLREEE